MDVQELLAKVQEAASVKQVFGEPYERDGVTVIPVAKVGGGGGGGGGEGGSEGGQGRGWGGGGGFGGQPVGVYVIKNGDVLWRPAVDVTSVLLRVQAVLIAALVTARALRKGRSRVGSGRHRR